MKQIFLQLPEFTESVIVTGTSYSDAEHRRAFTAKFRAEPDLTVGFIEKRGKSNSGEEKRWMASYLSKPQHYNPKGEWHMLTEEPPTNKRLDVTVMSKDRTRFERSVVEAKYDGRSWDVPETERVVAWRYKPDPFEGGYKLDDDGAKLLVEAIIYQIREDYRASVNRVVNIRKKINELKKDKKKVSVSHYRDKINKWLADISIEESKMVDIEKAVLEGWPGMVPGSDPESMLYEMRKEAADLLAEVEE